MRLTLLSLLLLCLACPAYAQADGAMPAVDGPAWQETYSAESITILEAAAQLPPVETTGPALRDILAKPEFQGELVDTTQAESMLEKLLNWLQQHLPSLFPAGSSTATNWVVVVLLGALVVLLAYLIVRVAWAFAARRGVKDLDAVDREDKLSTSEQLLAAATAAAGQGQYREALRLRFRAVVRELDLPATALLTNYQLIRKFEQQVLTAAHPFRQLVVCYEDAWYGDLPCGAEEYSKADNLAAQVEKRLAQDKEDTGAKG